ncbi:MAG: imidazole glycerol phosphate synthase subunit HisH [Bacteroidota bacterium]
MITIIDYGIGNLRSIEKAFERIGASVLRTDDTERIAEAQRLVLPGVGAFGACADEIRRRNLEPAIHHAVERGIPFLGVCVGMQLLFDGSDEMGDHRGLGLIPGRVTRFAHDLADADGHALKVPHMGWNTTAATRETPLLADLPVAPYFYFVHSYHGIPANAAHTLATCGYGVDFTAIVHRDNVYGVQFHPEKSQDNGLALLANFSRL